MIRPEARAQIYRYREVIVGTVASVFGLWLFFFPGVVLPTIGLLILGAGVVQIVLGIRRLRFGGGGDAPGTVRVDEARVAYFGPLTGGFADLDLVTEIAVDHRHHPGAHWSLRAPGHDALLIPAQADNAEALLDAFAALPGFDASRAIAALNARANQETVVWRRAH